MTPSRPTMNDLRTAVEGLDRWPVVSEHDGEAKYGNLIDRRAVLALIPEGAVLVTEETLDHAKYLAQAASHLADHLKEQYPTFYCEDLDNVRHFAAAILARIREGSDD